MRWKNPCDKCWTRFARLGTRDSRHVDALGWHEAAGNVARFLVECGEEIGDDKFREGRDP